MSRADRRRRKLQAHRTAARSGLATQPGADGLPASSPTPERLRHGDVRVQALISAATPEASARDWTGERPEDAPRKVAMDKVRRDLSAAVGHRLGRFKDLHPRQIAAAERLERDWEMAALEPRMIADLQSLGVGGGRSGPVEFRGAVIDARERLQRARTALRRGGPDVLRIVEGLVMFGATADAMGSPAYAGKRDASVHVRTLIGVGLNMLAEHYRGEAPSPG